MKNQAVRWSWVSLQSSLTHENRQWVSASAALSFKGIALTFVLWSDSASGPLSLENGCVSLKFGRQEPENEKAVRKAIVFFFFFLRDEVKIQGITN